jgi:hypothetical protein
MTEREKLIEAMARAICDEWGYLWDGDPDEDSQVSPETNKGYDERPSKLLFRTAATAALAAIEARIAELTRERDEARAGLRVLLSYTEQLELMVYSSEQNETVHPIVKAARTALEDKP